MSFISTVAIMDLICSDSEVIPVSGTSVGFTSTKITPTSGLFKGKKCRAAWIFVYNNAIYLNAHGDDADSDDPQLYPGQNRVFRGEQNVANIRMLRVNADATVKVEYYW